MAALSVPFLNPSAQEDSMELSSPGNRPLDEDIEIDFEEDYGAAAVHDEQMEDDGDHSHHAQQDEDMLQFDDNDANTTSADPNRFSTIADEDLIDYSDEEDSITPAFTTQPQSVNTSLPTDNPAGNTLSAVEHEASETLHKPQSATAEPPVASTIQPTATAQATAEISLDKAPTVEDPVVNAVVVGATEPTATDSKPKSATSTLPNVDDSAIAASDNAVPEEGVLKPRLSTTSFVPPTDGLGTPTDTGLHQVILYFEDQEYPLFRSRASSEGLLKDDNMVSVSLADLIKACRQSIVIRTRKELDENLELIFTFDDLSLSVYEDAPAAFQTSLQEVLDVYLQLQANDGHDKHSIPPLSISCSLHVKFNNSIVVLKNAAERGEGLSALVPSYEDEHHDNLEQEEGEYYEENVEGEQTVEHEGQYEELEDGAENTNAAEYKTSDEQEQWEDGPVNDDHELEEHDHEQVEDEVEDDGEAAQDETEDNDLAAVEHQTPVHDDHAGEGNEVTQEAADSSEEASTTLPALSDTTTPSNDPDADTFNTTHPSSQQDASTNPNTEHQQRDIDAQPYLDATAESDNTLTAHQVDPSVNDQDDHAYLNASTEHEQNNDHIAADETSDEKTAEDEASESQHDYVPTTEGNEQLHSTTLHPEADAEAAASEYELDLEDYDRPDATTTTSPTTKRRRDADDTAKDAGTTKKLRPS